MDLIREMANVIEKDRPKSFHLLIPRDSKLHQLYEMALEEDFLDDTFAATRLYDSEASDKRFIMLKGSLINKLSELVLLANHSDLNRKNFIAQEFKCEKQLTIARKLLYVNVYHNAERITKKVLKKSRKFHLANIELECYLTLRKISYLQGFPGKVEKYQQAIISAQEQVSMIQRANGELQYALAQVKFSRSQSFRLANTLQGRLNKLSKVNSPFYELYDYRIRLIIAHQQHNIPEWELQLANIDRLLQAFPYLETEHTMLEVNLSKLRLAVAVRKEAEVDRLFKLLEESTSFEAFNRFEVLGEQLEWYLQCGDYAAAAGVLELVFSEARYEELNAQDHAAWAIRAMYFRMLTHTSRQAKDQKPVAVQEFYQQSAAISKDKAGFQLQFLVVRAWALHIKGALDYVNEANNIKVYIQRHLKAEMEHLPRTRTFIKMFRKAMKRGFESASVKKAEDALMAHAQNPKEYCELIRYEQLLEYFQEKLQ